MFRDLQKGYSVSILEKNNGRIKYHNGTVVSRGEARYENKGFGQPMPTERIIDLTIEFDGKTQTYVVPENGNVASTAAITVACEPSYVTNEVQSMLKKSEDVLASIETHKTNIEECKNILSQINPSIGESQEYNRRLNAMESKMDGMSKLMEQIAASLNPPSKKEK